MSVPLLELEGVSKRFRDRSAPFGRRAPARAAVEEVNLVVGRGEVLGLVGESGSGKSTLARMIVGLERPSAGRIRFQGRELTALRGGRRAGFRRQVQLVFQEPASSLNPRKTVRSLLEAPLKVLLKLRKTERRERLAELMRAVNLGPELLERYPHELSGGQSQRVAIARALAVEPTLLILDEPVSALDVSIQAQILELLRELRKRRDLTYVFISHDLAVVERLCGTVAVMREGRIVEHGARERVFERPSHPYTRLLLSSVPVPGERRVTSGFSASPGSRSSRC